MAYFYNPLPQFEDINGEPILNGLLYFGEPDTDPRTNPKTIWLNEAQTVAAANPQPLNSRGVPSQGTIYLSDNEVYSFALDDAEGVQVAYREQIVGVSTPEAFADIKPVVIEGNLTVAGVGDAFVAISSGVTPNATGEVRFQENALTQFLIRREAIVDGGSLVLVNQAAGAAREIELILAGGVAVRYQGADRVVTTLEGVEINGRIGKAAQVAVAAGTFQADGTPVGETFGISAAGPVAGSPTGEYEITLSELPSDESNLVVTVSAELAGDEMLARGVGGIPFSSKALIFTSTASGTRANCTTFTVAVFDAGRA